MKKLFWAPTIITLAIIISLAINALNAKAETLEECIKRYQAGGASYDNAKLKCINVQTPTNTNIAPASAEKVPATTAPKTSAPAEETPVKKDTPEATAPSSVSLPPSSVSQKLIVPQPATLESCIKKYTDVFNISYEEAKAKCVNVPQVSETEVQLIEKRSNCAALENQLTKLSEKLRLAKTEQESANIVTEIGKIKERISSCQATTTVGADSCTEARRLIYEYEERLKKGVSSAEKTKIEKAIETQRTRLQKCGIQEATPGIKNPCDEIPSLKDTYEAMLKKEIQVRELVQNGELNEAALDDLQRQMEFIKKRLEQMRFACEQGEAGVEEAPCSRLAKLELVYSQNQDENAAKEIIVLKERCLTQTLTSEKPANLVDVEEIYKTKIKAAAENTFGQEQINIIKQTEEEKNTLIKEVLTKAENLDATRVSIVKKITIGDNKISLDGIEGNAVPVKIEVKGKEINVNQSGGKVVIEEAGIKAEGNVKIEYQDGKLISSASGKEINVLPSEIKEKIKIEPQTITIKDEAAPQYTVQAEVKAKLFGLIPITTLRNFEVDAQTGQSQEDRPWWSFLVKY